MTSCSCVANLSCTSWIVLKLPCTSVSMAKLSCTCWLSWTWVRQFPHIHWPRTAREGTKAPSNRFWKINHIFTSLYLASDILHHQDLWIKQETMECRAYSNSNLAFQWVFLSSLIIPASSSSITASLASTSWIGSRFFPFCLFLWLPDLIWFRSKSSLMENGEAMLGVF